MKKNILVIGGPTGVGESTITNELIKQYPIFTRLVTATTRKPRIGEVNKKDYYFFSNDEFFTEIKKGNILEYQNSRSKDIYYGTYKPDLENKIKGGKKIVVNPDIVGAKYYKNHYNAITIFILPDSIENLEKRHQARSADAVDGVKKRLEYAIREIENESPFYDYKIINKQNCLNDALREISEILKKEGYI